MSSGTAEKKGGKVVALLVLGLALLVGAAWAGAYWTSKDRIPRETTVSGVAIGGQTQDAAAATLAEQLGPRATKAMTVVVDGQRQQLRPEDAGLSVDYEATVAAVGGERSWNPRWLWDYFTGGDEVDPVVDVDEDALEAKLGELGAPAEKKARNGAVLMRNGSVRVRQPVVGQALDLAAAREAVQTAYLTDETAQLPVAEVQPDIDETDVRAAVDEFANAAMSGPVTLTFGSAHVRLTPQQYDAALSLVPQDGVLVPRLDEKVLFDLVDAHVSDSGAPVDATVRLVNGVPQVVPGKPGVSYQPRQLARAFMQVVAKADDRQARVKATVKKPDLTTQEARALGVKERVSTFTTYYPHAEYRNVNIGRAAQLIDGTLLEPGETFSLNDTVGERTAANGFTEGYIIQDGILTSDLGGGVSQIATTTYNAMFFAGLEDVEHKPHSFYISRYPKGREATVAWGAVDLRFKNDTPYGVLVSATVTPSTWSSSGVVTVSMYSTKYWNITTETGPEYAPTRHKVRKIDSLKCHENSGYDGFSVDYWRYFSPVGSNDQGSRTEKFTTVYTPSDTVVCTNPQAQDNVS